MTRGFGGLTLKMTMTKQTDIAKRTYKPENEIVISFNWGKINAIALSF